jgi:hypothetical protein
LTGIDAVVFYLIRDGAVIDKGHAIPVRIYRKDDIPIRIATINVQRRKIDRLAD